jgi:hypothetical protein
LVEPEPEQKKRSGVLGMMIGAVVLASAMSGGGVWYVLHESPKVGAMTAAQAPPPLAEAALPTAAIELNDEDVETIEIPGTNGKVATKATKRGPRPSKADKAGAKPDKPEASKPPPAPKPVNGGGVDAVLQQQLKGAL